MLKTRLLDSIRHEMPGTRYKLHNGYGQPLLAWNIRVDIPYDKADPAFQDWKFENSENLDYHFADCCSFALQQAIENINEQFPEDRIELKQAGRSGGWIVLTKWITRYNENYFDFDQGIYCDPVEGVMKEEMSRSALVKFRKLVKAINAEFSEEQRADIGAWINTCFYEMYQESLEERAVEIEAERPDMHA